MSFNINILLLYRKQPLDTPLLHHISHNISKTLNMSVVCHKYKCLLQKKKKYGGHTFINYIV